MVAEFMTLRYIFDLAQHSLKTKSKFSSLSFQMIFSEAGAPLPFLRHLEQGADGFLVFISDPALAALDSGNVRHIFGDGTFDSAPDLFSQVCVTVQTFVIVFSLPFTLTF